MDCRTSILKVEARLGFNFKQGLSKEHRAKQTNETGHLLERIHQINENYSHLNWKEIRTSEGVRSAAEKLLNDLGPTLWPDYNKIKGPFPTWLFHPDKPGVSENPHRDLYPRPLLFSDPVDNTLLNRHFYALICLKIFRYASNHNWKQSTSAKSNELDPHNYVVPGSDSEADTHTHDSTYQAGDHPEIGKDCSYIDDDDDDEASNVPASETSYLSSLSSTPELVNSMNMQPTVPVACMVPKQPLMGNTQAKLAASKDDEDIVPGSPATTGRYQKQFATSDKDRREWISGTLAEPTMQKTGNALRLSTKRHLESLPQPKHKIRRLNMHSGKRMTIGEYHETLKKRKQMQTQMEIQGIATAIGTEGHGQQSGSQARSTLVLPLSSSLLAQFATETNHGLYQSRDSTPNHDNTTQPQPPDRTQAQLNEDVHESPRQKDDVDSSPLALCTTNTAVTDQNALPSQDPAQLPEASPGSDARKALNDALASASETAGHAEPAGDTIVDQDNARARSVGMQIISGTQSTIPSEPRELDTEPGPGVEAPVDQPRFIPQNTDTTEHRTPEAEQHRDTIPAQLTANASNEHGLQDLVNKFETTVSSTDEDSSALRSVFFRLYLDEEADPLEPQCCVKLTGLTTRDDLFKMMHDDLQDDLDTGDQIVAVKVKRADGEVFRGPNVRTMPIKRVGRQDMWKELISTLVEHGAGEEGLRGYVKVKKCVDAK